MFPLPPRPLPMYLFRLDTSVPGVRYCSCSGKQQQSGIKVEEIEYSKYEQKYIPFSDQGEGWQPYVERADLLVWRREHASKRGLYEYKLYGQVITVTMSKLRNDLRFFSSLTT